MIVLAVTWVANAGREAEAVKLFQELAAESRKEPGCLMFLAHQHRTEPAKFLIYEQFADDAALDTHRASPHFTKYVKSELLKVAVRVDGQQYSQI
jgi:quinol monooxygenase YgiN